MSKIRVLIADDHAVVRDGLAAMIGRFRDRAHAVRNRGVPPLEGPERKRFIEEVAEYNKTVQRFPTSIGASMRGKSVRPTFEGTAGAEKPPEVKF